MSTVCIDPGKRVAGYAVHDGKAITACGVLYWRDDEREVDCPECSRLVIERMSLRTTNLAAVNSILRLAELSGVLVGKKGVPVRWLDTTWTGGRAKAQNHVRVRARLTAAERELLDHALLGVPGGHHKEALDAVGIALYDLRRL